MLTFTLPALLTPLVGAPHHPQTQGKIERWHQTLKHRIVLAYYFLPGALEGQIQAFIQPYACNTANAPPNINPKMRPTLG